MKSLIFSTKSVKSLLVALFATMCVVQAHAETDCLCFTSTGTAKICFANVNSNTNYDFQYSTDGETWKTYQYPSTTTTSSDADADAKTPTSGFIDISNGKKVYFRSASRPGNMSVGGESSPKRYQFIAQGDGEIYASGNVMSLLDSTCTQTLASKTAFSRLFYNMTNLITAPRIPATELGAWSCEWMFSGCTNLVSGPDIDATTLGEGACSYMFKNCTSLKYLSLAVTDGNYDDHDLTLGKILNGVTGCTVWVPEGLTNNYTSSSSSYETIVPSGCTRKIRTDANNWLNFYSSAATSTITLAKNNTPSSVNLVYSFDGSTWNNLTVGTKITLSGAKNRIFVSAGTTTNDPTSSTVTTNAAFSSADGYYQFVMTGNVSASGNIMSLLNSQCSGTSVPDYAFYHLFDGCSVLHAAPTMPATTVSAHCYEGMFTNCTSLASAPSLPATYLPAGSACYKEMFKGCSNLTYIGCLFGAWDNTDGDTNATKDWVNGVSISGQFENDNLDSEQYDFDHIPYDDENRWYSASKDFLCFTTEDASATVKLNKVGSSWTNEVLLVYSTGSGWKDYSFGTAITIENGGKLMFRAGKLDGPSGRESYSPLNNSTFSEYNNKFFQFVITGNVAASGNVMSLLSYDCSNDVVPDWAFFKLFYGCKTLTAAPNIPATQLGLYCCGRMFENCTSLVQAPNLPAKGMYETCYQYMFAGCTSLTTAPTLPATTMQKGCYRYMFNGCTALTDAPSLPATTLAKTCYEHMFEGCTALVNAPTLPATTMKDSCYIDMFKGCTSLTSAPALPATSMAAGCYKEMFYGCTGLSTAPALPATTLANKCYQGMFYGCTRLSSAPDLPATTLKTDCYKQMFYNCSNLSSIRVSFTSWTISSGYGYGASTTTGTSEWAAGVADQGTLFCPTALVNGKSNSSDWYNTSKIPVENTDGKRWTCITDPSLCFVATTAGTTVKLNKIGSPNSVSLQYSKDGGTWYTFTAGSTSITLENVGDFVLFRANVSSSSCSECGGDGYKGWYNNEWCRSCNGTGTKSSYTTNSSFSKDASNYYNFAVSGSAEVGGNILSLVCAKVDNSNNFSNMTLSNYYFCNLFANCTGITAANCLPTTLSTSCGEGFFMGMFENCVNLVKVSNFPAMQNNGDFKKYCYKNMFKNCTNLLSAPSSFSGNTLAESSFESMFEGCSKLVSAPALSSGNHAKCCYKRMFANCTSLVNAPSLTGYPAESSCEGMFTGCTAMTTIPTIPSKNASNSCYKEMFKGCTGLTGTVDLSSVYIGEAASCFESMFEDCTSLTETATFRNETGNILSRAYYAMYKGCTSLKTANSLNRRDLAESCYESMFENCSSLTAMPELGYTVSLATACMRNMFKGCKSLKVATNYTTGSMAANCFEGMFEGCDSLTNAPLLSQETLASECYKRMFYGCKLLQFAPELPAKTLSSGCYYEMFNGCSKLRYIDVAFGSSSSNLYWSADDSADEPTYTYHWVTGVASKGLFMCPDPLAALNKYDISHIPVGWSSEDNADYFCITPNGTVYLSFKPNGNPSDITVRISFDKKTWTSTTITSTSYYVASLNGITQPTYIKTSNGSWSTDESNYWSITSNSGNLYSASGNILSLIDGTMMTEEVPDYCFYKLFSTCGSSLTDVSGLNLPATKVGNYAYADMFDGCTYLQSNETTAPELPATTLGKYCYENLFSGWTKMTTSPELPAKTLAKGCYNGIFQGCTSLAAITVSFTKWLDGATDSWVDGVVDKGEFTCPADLLTNAIDKWGDDNSCYNVYGPSRIPKDADNGDDHKWIIILDVNIDFDYSTNLMTLSGGENMYYSTSSDLSASNATTVGTKYSAAVDVDADGWMEKVSDLDSRTYYAVSTLGTNISSDLIKSIVRSKTIYAYPKYVGYCLANSTSSLKKALFYGEMTSSANHPVRIFVPNGTYTLGDGEENLVVGDYVSLIGETTENTIINKNSTDAAAFKITGDNAYLQDMTIGNTQGYAFYNVGSGTTLHVAANSANSKHEYYTTSAAKTVQPVWATGSEWDCVKVERVIRNGGAYNVVAPANVDTFLLEMNDYYAIVGCNSFYFTEDIESSLTVRGANSRGAFGPYFSFANVEEIKAPTGASPYSSLPTITLNSKGYSSFYYESGTAGHRLQAVGASAFVAKCSGMNKPVTLYHINDKDIIPSGTGVILFGLPNATVTFYEDLTTDVSAYDEVLACNQLKGIVQNSTKYTDYNSLGSWTSESGTDYWYPGVANRFYGISGDTFMRLKESGKMKANKAFFDFGTSGGNAPSLRTVFGNWSDFNINTEEEEIIIPAVTNLHTASISNVNAPTYNLLGQRTTANKGLLVKNGKVVLVK